MKTAALLLLLTAACGPDLPPSVLPDLPDAGRGSVSQANGGAPPIDISPYQCDPVATPIWCPNGSGGPLWRCHPAAGSYYWTGNNEICP